MSSAQRAIVFPTGLYAPGGRDSVAIQNRDWMIGLHDLGVPVFALDMMEQGERSTILRVARTTALLGMAYGWPRAGTRAAGALVGCDSLLLPAVALARKARRRAAPVVASAPQPAEHDPDLSIVKSMLIRPRQPRRVDIEEIVCVLTGYDLMFAPEWAVVWKRAIAGHLRRYFPRVSRVRWCVHVVSETTRVAPSLVAGAELCDEVWVSSDFNVEALRRSGLRNVCVEKIPEAVDTDLFCEAVEPLPIPGRRRFAFMTVSQYVPAEVRVTAERQPTREIALAWNQARKATDLTIRAFLEEFGTEEDVCLVIKSTGDTAEVARTLHATVSRLGGGEDRMRQILPLGGWTATRDMPRVYAAADAFALVSRGEGWGRPLTEAMALAKPTIGTKFGGNTEFMNAANSFLVDCRLVPVSSVIGRKFEALGEWAEPSIPHMRATMRDIYANPVAASARARRGAVDVHRLYSRRAVAQRIVDRLDGKTCVDSSEVIAVADFVP